MTIRKISFNPSNFVSPPAENIGAIYNEKDAIYNEKGTIHNEKGVSLNRLNTKETGFLASSPEASRKRIICKKYGISAALTILFISCLTLVILALTGKNARAGLFTLQFNLNALLDKALGHRAAERDLFPTIPNIASAVTAIPGLATAAAGAIESAIPDAIEAVLPRNLSIGSLASGLVLSFVTSTISLAIIFDWFALLPKGMNQGFFRDGIHVFSIVFCCVPFLLTSVISYCLKSKIQHLPSWIPVELGKAYGFCLGSLGCAVCIMGLSVFVRFVF